MSFDAKETEMESFEETNPNSSMVVVEDDYEYSVVESCDPQDDLEASLSSTPLAEASLEDFVPVFAPTYKQTDSMRGQMSLGGEPDNFDSEKKLKVPTETQINITLPLTVDLAKAKLDAVYADVKKQYDSHMWRTDKAYNVLQAIIVNDLEALEKQMRDLLEKLQG